MNEQHSVADLAYTNRGPGAIAIVVCALALVILVVIAVSITGAYLYTQHVIDADRCRNVISLLQATANSGVPKLHAAYAKVAAADGCIPG